MLNEVYEAGRIPAGYAYSPDCGAPRQHLRSVESWARLGFERLGLLGGTNKENETERRPATLVEQHTLVVVETRILARRIYPTPKQNPAFSKVESKPLSL